MLFEVALLPRAIISINGEMCFTRIWCGNVLPGASAVVVTTIQTRKGRLEQTSDALEHNVSA